MALQPETPATTPDARIPAAAQPLLLQQNVPAELRAFPNFVLWSSEPAPTKKDPQHRTKVPYIAVLDRAPLRRAASDDRSTWRKFDAALLALVAHSGETTQGDKGPGKVCGIGFITDENDTICGIDLDDCIDENGVLADWAQTIVDSFASYTEVSPSGRGIRIFIRAAMPDRLDAKGNPIARQAGRRRGQIEAYSNARFFTLTGNQLPGTPNEVREAQDELLGFIAKYIDEPASDKASATRVAPVNPSPDVPLRGPVALDDRELLAKMFASKNGARIRALWDGDLLDYPSESEARMALLFALTWWASGDADRIDRLFRQSNREMANWDRLSFSTEIPKAIAKVAGGYDPNTGRVLSGASANGAAGQGAQDKPFIIVKNVQLDVMTRETLDALYAANNGPDGPRIFRRNSTLARVRVNEQGEPQIEQLTAPILRTILSEVADFGMLRYNQGEARKRDKQRDKMVKVEADTPEEAKEIAETLAKLDDDSDLWERVNMSPPNDLLDAVLSQANWTFPALDGIIEAPALRPDGTIIREPGYDAATRLIYAPSASIKLPTIPDAPTAQDVKNAVATLNEVIGEFPYDSDASRAHAFGLLLTGVARPAIVGRVPMALLTAPAAGTGKGLLGSVTPLIVTGREPGVFPCPKHEDEWRKEITTKLLSGTPFILVDEIQGKLGNGPLQAALTAAIWRARMLGGNKETSVQQNAIWMGVGNNIQLAGDMPRRVYRIRLDAKVVRPERRKGFKHPNLALYVSEHRGDILAALLTIARAWYAAGKPSANVTTMGNYEAWSETIGGMLAYAGISGFLSNLDEMYEEMDTERPAWGAFLEAWWDIWGASPVTANEVATRISNSTYVTEVDTTTRALIEALPEALMPYMTKVGELGSKLGYNLRKMSNMRSELSDGAIAWMESAGKMGRNGTTGWRVVRLPSPTSPDGGPEKGSQNGDAGDAREMRDSSPAVTNPDSISVRDQSAGDAGDVNSPSGYEKVKTDSTRVGRVSAREGLLQSVSPASPAQVASAQTDSAFVAAGDAKTISRVSPATTTGGTWTRCLDASCEHPASSLRVVKTGQIACDACGGIYTAPSVSA